jgi:uncharacterized protein YybS (DUF2232 family)
MTESPDPRSSLPSDSPASTSSNSNLESNLEAEWDEVERELTLSPPSKADSGQSTGNVPPVSVPNVDGETVNVPNANGFNGNVTVRSLHASSPLIMVETAFLASAASLLWLVNFYFPFPLLRVFFPIPIALIYLRWGNRAAWMGALVSGLLLSVLMGPPRSLLYVMPFAVMGVLLGLLWQRRASWGVAIVPAAIVGTLGFFFRVWLVSILLGDDLWLYSTTQVTNLIDRVCEWLGILYQPTLQVIQAFVIGLVIFNNLVYVFVVHLVAWFLFDRLGNPIPRPPKWVQTLMEYEE